MILKDDNLVYLDLEFISRKYEEINGINPGTAVTKQESKKADVKAFFASAGVTTQESRTFSITSRSMLHNLWEQLEHDYDDFSSFKNYSGTKIAWIRGELTIGEWVNRKEGRDEEKGYEFYQLNHGSERTALLSNDSYLAAGFAKALGASSALKGNIRIPVKCLARIMWHVDDTKNYVSCPYVIVETN